MRSRSRNHGGAWAALIALLTTLSGCAFDDGQPWGRAVMSLEASFAPAESRLTADGLLRTSNNYLIDVTSLSIYVESMSTTVTQEGAAAAFDPAAPPDGYSLCHGGHCHAADGSLVSYEDIAAEIAGGDSAAPSVSQEADAEVTLTALPTTVAFEDCPQGCRLERGELTRADVLLTEVRFEARIYDSAPTDGKGLPDEGIPVRGVVPLAAKIGAPLTGSVAQGEPVGVRISASLTLAESLFDGVDWTSELGLSGPVSEAIDAGAFPAIAALVAENLATGSTLAVTVERFDP